jgi:hypothetical protein
MWADDGAGFEGREKLPEKEEALFRRQDGEDLCWRGVGIGHVSSVCGLMLKAADLSQGFPDGPLRASGVDITQVSRATKRCLRASMMDAPILASAAARRCVYD